MQERSWCTPRRDMHSCDSVSHVQYTSVDVGIRRLHLGDDGHARAQLVDAEARDVQAVDSDAASVQLHETENAVDQAALAGACGRTCNVMITTLKVSW